MPSIACRHGRAMALCALVALSSAPPAGADFLESAAANRLRGPIAPGRFLALEDGDDPAVLDAHLARIFDAGKPAQPGQDEALRIMAYAARLFATKDPGIAMKNATDVLARPGTPNLCGHKAVVVEALCRRIGLPARRVSLRGLERIDEHIVNEVYFDGAWHFLDPSFGAFFYSRPAFDGKGVIASIDDLKCRHALLDHGFFLGAEELGQGRIDAALAFVPISPEGMALDLPVPLAAFYRDAFLSGFPAMNASRFLVSIPMTYDLRKQTKTGPDRAIHYLGYGDVGNVYHTLALKTPGPGWCRVTYTTQPLSAPPAFLAIELKDVVVAWVDARKETWSLFVYVQSAEGLLLVANAARNAILIENYWAVWLGADYAPPENEVNDEPASTPQAPVTPSLIAPSKR